MKRLRILIVLLLAMLTMPSLALAATLDATPAADPSTATTWRNWGLENSTQNVGRIWTDKTVSAGDIVLSGAGGEKVIEKGDSDFLTAFSAISSTSNLRETASTPLDIVLVLDASGSMDDPMGRTDSTRRIDALKEAANSFIDEIEARNAGITNEAQQHRVSIVKFAGNTTNRVGNDTYNDGRYTYNYSQAMQGMTLVDANAASTLKSTVDSIKPAGATRSDYGLKLAQTQLSSARPGARKVVVFFTDGKPTSFSDFDPSVAAGAVEAAKSMKDAGTTIYTIGIFDGADATADVASNRTSNENKFMQAASSNYPAATYTSSWWDSYTWNFGTRAENAAFYKTATNADELKTIFNDISKEISDAAGYPTDTTDGMENRSGYVTFTDQLGDYMKVDDFNYVVFANQIFDAHTKTTSGNVDTYAFSGEAGNSLYPSGNLSDIVIEVRRAAEGDLRTGDHVTVKISAALIPLRAFDVNADDGTGSVTLTFPIRVFFGSSLKDGVEELLANPDEQMADYLANHTDEDGKVFFLANAWSGGSDGDATASFTPAEENSYYYITRDTPIYEDEALTNPASYPLVAGKIYYYQRQYWDIADSAATQKSNIVSFDSSAVENINGYVTSAADGHAQFAKGTRRMTYINELHDDKDENATATATSFINPKWAGSQVLTHLGNNGKLTLTRPGSLEVEKHVEVPEGYDAADFANDEFEFTVTIPDAAGKTLKATVTKDGVVQGDESFDATFDENGAYSHKLKDGEKLTVTGLDGGWNYKVSEAAKSGWTTASEGVEGAIAAGAAASAKFTNTYAATGTLVGRTSLAGEKTITGRDWVAGDKFAFVLTAVDGAPMPADAVDGKLVKIMMQSEGASGATATPFNFGDITYTKPGTYVYNIVEARAGDGYDVSILPGMSVSQALYRVTVTVTQEDAHDGTLKVESSMLRLKDDSGAALGSGAGESTQVAAFTNEFNVKEAEWDLRGTKHYTDNSGTNPLVRGMFKFELTAKTEGAPMPANTTDGKAIAEVDTTGRFAFEQVTFDEDDVGQTYEYELREVNEGKPGYTYDDTVWNIAVKVTAIPSETEGEPATVVLEVTNTRSGQEAAPGETISFENSYNVTPATVEGFVRGTKTILGRDSLDGEKFSFSLTQTSGPADGCTGFSPTAEVTDLKDGVAQGFDFGTAAFTRAGAYTFEVRENAPETPVGGMTYDSHVSTVTIKVDDEDGQLVVISTTYSDADLNGPGAFVNRYAPTETSYYPGLTVSKVLDGRKMEAGEFSFTIEAKDSMPEAGTAATTAEEADALLAESDRNFSNDESRASGIADEMSKLAEITFNASHAGKTYAFDVYENVPAEGSMLPSIAYDTTRHELLIAVVDNLDGTLSVNTKIDGVAVEAGARVISFRNVYRAQDVSVATADLGLGKVLEGVDEWRDSDRFTFELKATTSGAPMPTDESGEPLTSVTVGRENVSNGVARINFGTISFTRTGQYEYEVSEVNGGLGGISYDDNIARIRITVRDDVQTGKLVATTEIVDGSVTFTNRYDSSIPEGKQVEPHFTKVLAGRDWREGDAFTFEIVAKTEGAPLPVDDKNNTVTRVTVHNAEEAANFTFGIIPFSYDMVRDGGKTFVYEVRELPSGLAGVTDSTNVATVSVTVADEGDGTMSASVTNANNTFTNTYVSELDYGASGGLTITKTLSGRAMSAGEFGIDVVATGDGDKLGVAGHHAVPASADGVEALVVSASGGITFSQQDVGKTYSYTISEVAGSLGGITYDQTTYDVTITTSDDPATATLTVTTTVESSMGERHTYTYASDGTASEPVKVSFHNAYAASGETPVIMGTKTMNNGLMLDGDFTFRLAYAAGSQDVVAATTNQSGAVDFGTLRYDTAMLANLTERGLASKEGDEWAIPYIAYEVTDGLSDQGVTPVSASFSLSVKVRDKGDGTLSCELDLPDGGLSFRNSYSTSDATTVSIRGTKVLEGRALKAGEFTFTIEGEDGAPMPERVTVANDAVGNVDFGSITFTLDDLLRALGEDDAATNADEPDGAEQAVDVPIDEDSDGDPAPEVEDGNADTPAPEPSESVANEPGDDGVPAAEGEVESENSLDASIDALDNHVEGESRLETAAWRRTATALRMVSDTIDGQVRDSGRERSHTFRYTVLEQPSSLGGVTNDENAVRDIYVKVTDDGSGKLAAEVVDADGKPVEGSLFTFTNTYAVAPTSVEITAKKLLNDAEPAGHSFQFRLNGAGANQVVTSDEAGNVSFSLGYDKAGTYSYTLSEINDGQLGVTYDKATFGVTVRVTDSGDGQLVAEVSYEDGDPIFHNRYTPVATTASITAAKVLCGGKLVDGQFTFRLTGAGVDVLTTNDEFGQVSFQPLTFDEVGTYTYTISEVNDGQAGVTYDTATYTVRVIVTDRAGQLHAEVSHDGALPVFRNVYEAPTTPSKPASGSPRPTRHLPQTGDGYGAASLMAIASVGVALIGFAVWARKR